MNAFRPAWGSSALGEVAARPKRTAWRHLWLMPFHAIAVLSSAKSFRDNSVIGSERLNRRGLHVARRKVAALLGARRRRILAATLDADDRAAIDHDGFVVKRDFLTRDAFEALRREVLALHAPAREAIVGDVLTRLIPLSARTLRDAPVLRRTLESNDFRSLLAYAGSFRRRPDLYVQTVFSHHCDGARDIQSFYHSDTFHPTVKAWLYLHDVEEDEAALSYVPGSHRVTARRLAWERRVSRTASGAGDRLTAQGSLRFAEADIRRLGYGPPVPLPARANTLIVADTSGIHRRNPTPSRTVRLSIWAYSRSNPFLPFPGGDATALPVLKDLSLSLYWFVADRLSSRRTPNSWRWVGRRAPLAPAVAVGHAPPPHAPAALHLASGTNPLAPH